MDEVYNTMVLNIYYLVLENITLSTLHMATGSCNTSIFPSVGSFHRALFINVENSNTHIEDKKE
jgi:hypothetical protein